MFIKKTVNEKLFNLFNILLMIILTIITIYPFLYVVFASFSSPSQLMQQRGILFWPHGFSLKSYKAVFNYKTIWISYRNTIFYLLAGTTLNMILTCLGAYGLSRKNVLLSKPIMIMITFTMFFSGGLIPTYLLVKKLEMLNTVYAIFVPNAISTMNLIIMRTSFKSIPESLDESARMDGANDFIILFRIIIPLSIPVISVITLYYSVAHWNSWFNAMIYLRNRNLYPLQLVLREILISQDIDDILAGAVEEAEPISETIKYAIIVVATVPILLVYPFLQKYFVKGVMIGAIKG